MKYKKNKLQRKITTSTVDERKKKKQEERKEENAGESGKAN